MPLPFLRRADCNKTTEKNRIVKIAKNTKDDALSKMKSLMSEWKARKLNNEPKSIKDSILIVFIS